MTPSNFDLNSAHLVAPRGVMFAPGIVGATRCAWSGGPVPIVFLSRIDNRPDEG